MKKLFVLFFGLALLVPFKGLQAQDNLTEVYTREHIPNKKPVPYEYIRESDVMWSKTVYRMIDLRQKQNHALYYPTQPIGSRMNLIDLLLYGIDNEGVRAFSTDDILNEFTVQLTRDQIDFLFDAGIDTVMVPDENGIMQPQIVESERKTYQIKKIMVKENWFF
ncbi:MAG: gliding motility protein GldN, partial [Bacteroidales bacterium]|nr:gliding motility protein GldN [Bacteroidales bacterium]